MNNNQKSLITSLSCGKTGSKEESKPIKDHITCRKLTAKFIHAFINSDTEMVRTSVHRRIGQNRTLGISMSD